MTSSLRPAGSTRRWRRLRVLVLHRDGFRCQLWVDSATGQHVDDELAAELFSPRRCGEYAEHVDHVIGRRYADAAGMVTRPDGSRVHVDAPSNLRASCAAGNLGRPRNDHAMSGRPNGGRPVTQNAPRRWSW
jgi:hypothetical protein